TRTVAVGAMCIRAQAGVGVITTQAWTNPLLAVDGLELLKMHDATSTLETVLADDPDPELRQLGIIDANGNAAAHTGLDTTGWAGHREEHGFVVAGNMLVSSETLDAMAERFSSNAIDTLGQRLLQALASRQKAGGEKRGRQSAALLVVRDQPYPWLDLRVDEHPDPVKELQRIYDVDSRELRPFISALPTRQNPAGKFTTELRQTMLANT